MYLGLLLEIGFEFGYKIFHTKELITTEHNKKNYIALLKLYRPYKFRKKHWTTQYCKRIIFATTNLLFNEPCEVDGLGVIYPISVGDYKNLQKYIQYLIFSEKHLNLTKEAKLLNAIIVMIAGSKCKDVNNLIELNEKILK